MDSLYFLSKYCCVVIRFFHKLAEISSCIDNRLSEKKALPNMKGSVQKSSHDNGNRFLDATGGSEN